MGQKTEKDILNKWINVLKEQKSKMKEIMIINCNFGERDEV